MILDLTEIWKDVPNYEGIYQVSNYGHFRRLSNLKQLRLNLLKKGYYHITLYKDGVAKTFKAHRLTGKAFIPNPQNKPEINHKDGNKRNNYKGNLEWNTRAENNRHAIDTGLLTFKKGESNYWHGKTRGQSGRKKLVLDFDTGVYYDCAKDAADAKGVSYSFCKLILQGKRQRFNIKYV